MALVPSKSTNAQTDIVFTPKELAKAVINALPLCGNVLDPAKGEGAFSDNFPETVNVQTCEISEGNDFFQWDQHVDWCVTNPPWSIYRKFASKAYQIADNVAFLVTINHDLALTARFRDMKEAGFGIKKIFLINRKPAGWPQSGFQLGVVWKVRGYQGPTEWGEINW